MSRAKKGIVVPTTGSIDIHDSAYNQLKWYDVQGSNFVLRTSAGAFILEVPSSGSRQRLSNVPFGIYTMTLEKQSGATIKILRTWSINFDAAVHGLGGTGKFSVYDLMDAPGSLPTGNIFIPLETIHALPHPAFYLFCTVIEKATGDIMVDKREISAWSHYPQGHYIGTFPYGEYIVKLDYGGYGAGYTTIRQKEVIINASELILAEIPATDQTNNQNNNMSTIRYRVQLSPTADFSNPIQIDNISGTSVALEQFVPLFASAYGATLAGDLVYWRVQEYDTSGEYADSDWSEVWSMTVAEAEQPPVVGSRAVHVSHYARTLFEPTIHDTILFHEHTTYRFRYQNTRNNKTYYVEAVKADFVIPEGVLGYTTTQSVLKQWQKEEETAWDTTDLVAGDQLAFVGMSVNAGKGDANLGSFDGRPSAEVWHTVQPTSALVTILPEGEDSNAVVQSVFKTRDYRFYAFSQNADGTKGSAWKRAEAMVTLTNPLGDAVLHTGDGFVSATGGTTWTLPIGLFLEVTPKLNEANNTEVGYTIASWLPGAYRTTTQDGDGVVETEFIAQREPVVKRKLPKPILVSPANNATNVALSTMLVWRRGETDSAGTGGGGGNRED